jgi:hypothetical protein
LIPYAEQAAKDLGVTERTVRRAVARGEKITDVADLAGTSLDKGDELDALAKLPKGEQEQLIAAAKAGEQVSAKAKPESTPATPAIDVMPSGSPRSHVPGISTTMVGLDMRVVQVTIHLEILHDDAARPKALAGLIAHLIAGTKPERRLGVLAALGDEITRQGALLSWEMESGRSRAE